MKLNQLTTRNSVTDTVYYCVEQYTRPGALWLHWGYRTTTLFRSFKEHPTNWKRLVQLLLLTFFTSDFSRLMYTRVFISVSSSLNSEVFRAKMVLSTTRKTLGFLLPNEWRILGRQKIAIGYWFLIKSVFLSSSSLQAGMVDAQVSVVTYS